MADEKFDVIVVGAGIMGSSAAYNTAKSGRKTLLLEQFDFLHYRGSSHGESRTLRANYQKPHYPQLVMESVRLWKEAESEIGYQVYFPGPQIDMGPASDPAISSIVDNCNSVGIETRILNPGQVAEEFSGTVVLPEDWVAVFSDIGGVIKPTKAVSMFQSLALRNGAVLRDSVEVTGIEKKDEGILVFSSEGHVFHGSKCIVTAGPWMRKLIKSVTEMEIPIQPLETSVMYWKIKEGHEVKYTMKSGFPTFSSYGDLRLYGTPSFEFPGLMKVNLHEGRWCEPGSRTWTPLDGAAEKLGGWIKEKFGGLVEAERPTITQSCMYSMTPDGDYIIDFIGGVFEKDLVIAGGFSGHGFKTSPVIGRILGDMIIKGVVNDVEMSFFGLDRFKGNSKGNAK